MAVLPEIPTIDRDLLDQIIPLGGLPIACKLRSKEPCGPWKHVTSVSPGDIDRVGEYVEVGGNWAIILGKRLGVLDVDNHGNAAGAEALDRLPRLRWLLEHRYAVKTGSGFHLYVELPPTAYELPSRLVGGVEWRTGRKYVMGPGSIHPDGGLYTAMNDGAEIASWEEFEAVLEEMALVYPAQQLMATQDHAEKKVRRSHRSQSQTRKERKGLLLDLQRDEVPEGKRHDYVLGSAIEMWHAGLSSYELEVLLQIINTEQCIEPLPVPTIEGILTWVCKLPRYWYARMAQDPQAKEKVVALNDFLNRATTEGRFVSKTRFYEMYREWARSSGRPALNRRTLQEALLQRGFKPRVIRFKGRCVRGYVGIKAKTGFGNSKALIRNTTHICAYALVGLRPQPNQRLNHEITVVTVGSSLAGERVATECFCDSGPPWIDPKGQMSKLL